MVPVLTTEQIRELNALLDDVIKIVVPVAIVLTLLAGIVALLL